MAETKTGTLTFHPESIEKANKPGEETSVTIHRIIESAYTRSVAGGGPDLDFRLRDIIYRDLFDSRPKVVISALSALGKIRDNHSVEYISRLFTHEDEEVKDAAVKAAGDIGDPGFYKPLLGLFKTVRNENILLRVMTSLSKTAPSEPEVKQLIREHAVSSLVPKRIRATAFRLLLEMGGTPVIKDSLPIDDDELMEAAFIAAENTKELTASLIRRSTPLFSRPSQANRTALVRLASSFTFSDSLHIIFRAIEDTTPEVRMAAYRAIGNDHEQVSGFPAIVQFLADRTENLPDLEFAVHSAITRMEEQLSDGYRLDVQSLKKEIILRIEKLFTQIISTDRRISGDYHELGWMITRSCEYFEYYGDEEFRSSLLNYFKRSGNYTELDLLRALKNSAVKIEVRHFDGFKALIELIKNPDHQGMALVRRELSLVRTGKRRIMYQLIRNIRMTRLFQFPEAKTLFSTIFEWSKEKKLYRLAEAALYALENVDKNEAALACSVCMTPPVFSKILAIASMRLIKGLDWDTLKPYVVKLIGWADDPYILLNVIDALSGMDVPPGSEVVGVLLPHLRTGTDREIVSGVTGFLGEKADFSIFGPLKKIFYGSEEWKQALILQVFEKMIEEKRVSNREGLSEFLYGLLRDKNRTHHGKAAILLYKMEDDYALNIFKGLIETGTYEEKANLVRGLRGVVNSRLAPLLVSLIHDSNTVLQEAVRETVLNITEEATINKILTDIGLKTTAGARTEEMGDEDSGTEIEIDFQKERKAYTFEKEHIQELAVFFTDIKGYTRKAQILTSIELTSLIQDYERILIPVVTRHRGSLIKKMGDGHLFVFQSPLDAALAGIRLQKALRRFNNYREDRFRISIRVGIHWGEVVKKDGDVFGNNVNIASRLETSASPGSVLISSDLNEKVKEHIHSREIGLIKVKGIEDPIRVYEPYEIKLEELPEDMDSAQRGRNTASSPLMSKIVKNGHTGPNEESLTTNRKSTGSLEPASSNELESSHELLMYFKETIHSLTRLYKNVEAGEKELTEIKTELLKRWKWIKDKTNVTGRL